MTLLRHPGQVDDALQGMPRIPYSTTWRQENHRSEVFQSWAQKGLISLFNPHDGDAPGFVLLKQ